MTPGFKTLAHMTPDEAEQARRDGIAWAKAGLATSDTCDRCGRKYGMSNPDCPVNKLHGQEELCCVLECESPAQTNDTYCAHHALVADDMERLYRGAVIAGWFEGERP